MSCLASLCIPTRDRADFIARTLTSFVGQDTRDFEVVVVDDGSVDHTREVVTAFGKELDLRYIRRAQTGISRARNAAIRASRGELLILTDDDRVADPSFVSDHLAAHRDAMRPRVVAGRQRGLFAEWSRDAAYAASDVASLLARHPALAPRLTEPRAELVTTAMLRDDLRGTLAAYELDEPWWERHAKPILGRYGETFTNFKFPWTLGVGGNVSMPRELAERVGLHDESYVGWGLEDTDFHYQLHRAGAETRVAAGALNYHQVHRRGPERGVEWARNAMRFLGKFDTLEVVLYLATCRRALSLSEANEVLVEAERIAQTAPAVVAELTRVHREQFRLAVAQVL